MNVSTSTANDPTPAESAAHRESLAAFLTFVADTIGVAHHLEGGLLNLEFDHRQHPAWPKPYHVKVAVAGSALHDPPRRAVAGIEGARWLWNLVDIEHGAVLVRPARQPESVHEFSNRLFDAYQVEDGQAQLAGCRLTEVPFLQVTQLSVTNPAQVEHAYYDASGEHVSESTLANLHLADVVPLDVQATSMGRKRIASVIENAALEDDRFIAVTLVVAKRAEGAVQFGIGEQCARTSFDDWTTTLVAPPFRCAATGSETFHLAAIDDGRIVAADAIERCEESGARVLDCERITCAVTGKKVDPRLITTCPQSGDKLLTSETATCAACGQAVSPKVLGGGVCEACRRLPSVDQSNTLVARLIERYPALGRYRKFQAGEAGGLVRVVAIGWWRRLQLTMPTGSDSPTQLAIRQGLVGRWEQVPTSEWSMQLGYSN